MGDGIAVSALIREQAIADLGVDYKQAEQFSEVIDVRLKASDWVSTLDGTTFDKMFAPGQPQKHLNAGIRCSCMNVGVKLSLEGALIHEIRKERESAEKHEAKAVEFEDSRPSLAQGHRDIAKTDRERERQLEVIRNALSDVPECRETEAFSTRG